MLSAGSTLGTASLTANRTHSLALPRLALWAIMGAKLLAAWGVMWDIQWHVRIGRDSFWIPPHTMTYAGVSLVVMLSFGMLAWYTAVGADGRGIVRVLGIRGTRGFQLAAWGVAITVLAAPIDDLWHRLFGLDVTLWSPPHLMGFLGGQVNSAACLVIAREVYPERPALRRAAMILSGALLASSLGTVAQPAFLLAYQHGGVAFHAPAILTTLLVAPALVVVAALSRLRSAPVLASLVIVALVLAGQSIARVGFDRLQPVSVIDEEIAKDPTSPIAVTTAIARKNRDEPGQRGLAPVIVGVVAAAAMAAIDARRRPVAASLAYGGVLFTLLWQMLARAPAFAPMAPGAGATLAGLALLVAAAAAAGLGGRALARALGDDR